MVNLYSIFIYIWIAICWWAWWLFPGFNERHEGWIAFAILVGMSVILFTCYYRGELRKPTVSVRAKEKNIPPFLFTASN